MRKETKTTNTRLNSLKALAEKKQSPSKARTDSYRDELAKITLVDAIRELDFGQPQPKDTSFYDFDTALAAKKSFSKVDQ